ncbi:unnamed protein product, partial [Amoebophrya sp. A120]|eukprot:GSA120T00007754001.1
MSNFLLRPNAIEATVLTSQIFSNLSFAARSCQEYSEVDALLQKAEQFFEDNGFDTLRDILEFYNQEEDAQYYALVQQANENQEELAMKAGQDVGTRSAGAAAGVALGGAAGGSTSS